MVGLFLRNRAFVFGVAFFILSVLLFVSVSQNVFSGTTVSNGCCLNITSGSGSPGNSFYCQEKISQSDCCGADNSYCIKNLFKPGATCDDIPNCSMVCCCNSKDTGALFPGPVHQGRCLNEGGIVNLTIPTGSKCSEACHGGPVNPVSPVTKDCYKFKPSFVKFSSEAVKGRNSLNLGFNLNCTSDVKYYFLFRCQCSGNDCSNCLGALSSLDVSNPQSVPSSWQMFKSVTNSYVDSGLNVSYLQGTPIKYAYVLGVEYFDGNREYNYTLNSLSDVKFGDPGNAVCYGVTDNSKFCINDVSYYFNNPARKNFINELLSSNNVPGSTSVASVFSYYNQTGGYCDDHNKYVKGISCDGSNACTLDSSGFECKSTECSKYNTFGGLSSDENGCLSNYCFYDQGPTLTKYCYNCITSMSCYDYKTKQACNQDNCGLDSQGKDCVWLKSNSGMGLCFDNVSKNCNFCGKSSSGNGQGIFTNDSVSPYVYTCLQVEKIVNDNGLKCSSVPYDCSNVASCYSYSDNRSACLDSSKSSDNTNFHLNNDNVIEGTGNNLCGISDHCYFNTASGCVRNVMGSGNDCGTGSSDTCKDDYFPPKTSVTISGSSNKINYGANRFLFFTISDKSNRFLDYREVNNLDSYTLYICNKNLTSGDPYSCSNRLRSNPNALKISFSSTDSSPYSLDVSDVSKYSGLFINGQNVLEFFTKDPAGNYEVVKNKTFYVDLNYCRDSDGGLNYSFKGTVSGVLNNVPFSINDSCYDSSELKEFYCAGGVSKSYQKYTCPSGTVCNDGACVDVITSCQSKNNGIDLTFFDGRSESKNNYCKGNILYNYSCDSSSLYSSSAVDCSSYGKICSQKGSKTTCIDPPNMCIDSDGGNKPLIFGSVSGIYNKKSYDYKDSCVSNNKKMLVEWYCKGAKNLSSNVDCTTLNSNMICNSGCCVYNTTSCQSTSTGIKIRLVDNSVMSFDNSCLSDHKDFCGNNVLLNDSSCDGTSYLTQILNCSQNNQICGNSRCYTPKDSCTAISPSETISGFTFGYDSGKCYLNNDSCVDDSTLNETFCKGSKALSKLATCPTGDECFSGACVPKIKTCKKSGIVVMFQEKDNGNYNSVSDFCSGNTAVTYSCNANQGSHHLSTSSVDCALQGKSCIATSTQVYCGCNNDYGNACTISKSCSSDGLIAEVTNGTYDCSGKCVSNPVTTNVNCSLNGKICSDGKCVLHKKKSCSDADSGITLNISSYVDGFDASFVPFLDNDSCVSNKKVKEFYCKDSSPLHVVKTCPTSDPLCVLGACVKPASSCKQGLNGVSGVLENGSSYDFKNYCSKDQILVNYSCSSGNYVPNALNCSELGLYCVDGVNGASCQCNYNNGSSCTISKCLDNAVVSYTGTYDCSGKCVVSNSDYSLQQNCSLNSQNNVCSNGKCISNVNSCTDSDGGKKFYVSGNISGVFDSQYYDFSDMCQGSILDEMICNGNLNSSFDYNCSRVGDLCSDGICQPNHCSDGKKDYGETGVDCGGGCKGCNINSFCRSDDDCAVDLTCTNNHCVPPASSCKNGILDGTETDVDCGGSCTGCGLNQKCNSNNDCSNGFFCITSSKGSFCSDPNDFCMNGVLNKNNDETYVDCGGKNCLPCNSGKKCDVNSDCVSGLVCDSGTCSVPKDHCKNSVLDPFFESATDCGITCPPCFLGQLCTSDYDCLSGLSCSINGKCENRTSIEKDVGSYCSSSAFCKAGLVCTNNQCEKEPEHCFNAVLDSDETGIDCGGSCRPCGLEGNCSSNNDCFSGLYCVNGSCEPTKTNTNHCTNKVKDYGETDVDCGGTCGACDNGQMCNDNSDCGSGGLSCYQGICSYAKEYCTDGKKDYGEIDIDCGGACGPCQNGFHCLNDSNCVSKICSEGVCTQSNSSENTTRPSPPEPAGSSPLLMILIIILVVLAGIGGLWYYDFKFNDQKLFGQINKKALEYYYHLTGKKPKEHKPEEQFVGNNSLLFDSDLENKRSLLKTVKPDNKRTHVKKHNSLFDEFDSKDKKNLDTEKKESSEKSKTDDKSKTETESKNSLLSDDNSLDYKSLDELFSKSDAKKKDAELNKSVKVNIVGKDSNGDSAVKNTDEVIKHLNDFAKKHGISDEHVHKFISESAKGNSKTRNHGSMKNSSNDSIMNSLSHIAGKSGDHHHIIDDNLVHRLHNNKKTTDFNLAKKKDKDVVRKGVKGKYSSNNSIKIKENKDDYLKKDKTSDDFVSDIKKDKKKQ